MSNKQNYVNFSSSSMSQEEFDRVRNACKNNEPVIKVVPLNSIEIKPDSVAMGYVNIGGRPALVERSFFYDLGRIVKVGKRLSTSLVGGRRNEDETAKAQRFLAALMAQCAVFASQQGRRQVTLIGDTNKGTITNIIDKGSARLPNEQLFKLAERLIDQHGLTPHGLQVHNDGFGVNIALASNDMHEFNKNGLIASDETFKFGVMLGNTPTNTALGDFALRLVCSNGMEGTRGDYRFRLNNTNDTGINDFLNHVGGYAQQKFMPDDFASKLELASDTRASFSEIEEAVTKVSKQIYTGDALVDAKNKTTLIEKYFPGYADAIHRMAVKKIMPDSITNEQKKKISTSQGIWTVINALTFLGSHNAGLGIKNSAQFIKTGGKLFRKEWDLAYGDLLN